jgi:hypothetical protein
MIGSVGHRLKFLFSVARAFFREICLSVHAVLFADLAFFGLGDDHEFFSEFRAAFQQAAVQVEHVAGVSLAARRAAEQQ